MYAYIHTTHTHKQTDKHFDFDALRSLSYSEHNPAGAWPCHSG